MKRIKDRPLKRKEDHQKLPRRGPRRTLDRSRRPAVQWRARPVRDRQLDRGSSKKVSMKRKRKRDKNWREELIFIPMRARCLDTLKLVCFCVSAEKLSFRQQAAGPRTHYRRYY